MLRGAAEPIRPIGDRNSIIVPLREIRNQLSSWSSCSIGGGSSRESRERAASIPMIDQVTRRRQRSQAHRLLTIR